MQEEKVRINTCSAVTLSTPYNKTIYLLKKGIEVSLDYFECISDEHFLQHCLITSVYKIKKMSC